MAEKICRLCDAPISGRYTQRVYCSYKCRLEHNKRQRHELNPYLKVCTTGQTGAMSEMLVCVDLLKRGFDVFRAVAQSCSCDIVALRNGRMFRVEVKTAYRRKTGTVGVSLRPDQKEKFDILAMVWLDNNEIVYEPSLPI